MAVEVAKLVATIGVDDSELRRGLSAADARIQATGQRLQNVGRALSLGVTAPLVAMGVAAAKTAGEFEQTLNVFRAVSGATAEEMRKVQQVARDLGADMSLPNTSAKDATEAMLELSKAGLSVADTMDAARGVLQLSAAAQISNAHAAQVVGDALNAFSLAGKEAARVTDLLAAAANAASGEIPEFADAMKMSAAVAHAAGVPVEDLTTAITLMAKAGIRGSDAGTSLKVMLLSLMAPTDKAAQALKDLGVQVYDAQGKMLPLRELTVQFSKALAGLSQEQQNAALKTIFGTDAIRGALNVLAKGPEAWDAVKSAVTQQGVAAEVAGAQTQGLTGALEALRNAWETLATSPGMLAFIKALAVIIRGVAEVMNLFAMLPAPLQVAAIALAGVTAAAGPLILALGTIVRFLPELRAVAGAVGALGAAGAVRAWLGGGMGAVAAGAAGAAGGGAGLGLGAALGAAGAAGLAAGAKGALGRAGQWALRGGWRGVGPQLGAQLALGLLPGQGPLGYVKGAGQWGLMGAALGARFGPWGAAVGGAAGAAFGIYGAWRGQARPSTANKARTGGAGASWVPAAPTPPVAAYAPPAATGSGGAQYWSPIPLPNNSGIEVGYARAMAEEDRRRRQAVRDVALGMLEDYRRKAAAIKAEQARQAMVRPGGGLTPREVAAQNAASSIVRVARAGGTVPPPVPPAQTVPSRTSKVVEPPARATPGGGGGTVIFQATFQAVNPSQLRAQVEQVVSQIIRRAFPAGAYG